ncbi:uncharacterized protein LOC143447086 [Clavelina lepadiformis]|uniref:uncharacterized protein LOC143447086 n=1 Tax=Clavelina lepadiformis TaxID=159417 RepID=UPI004041707A
MSALKFSDKEKTNCKNIKSNIGCLMATKEKDKGKHFSCKVCDKSFKHKSNLNSHSRTHTGEQPYQCRICCKSFSLNSISLNSNLQNHMKAHTGERPYQCDLFATLESNDSSVLVVRSRLD